RRLTREVMELDEPYRSAIILRFFEGLMPREIGARTGVPAETARTRVNRGLATLRERLDAEHSGAQSWRALLVPIAGLSNGTSGHGPSIAAAGGVAMTTGKTLALAGIGIALLVGAWWWMREDGVAATQISSRIETAAEPQTNPPSHS